MLRRIATYGGAVITYEVNCKWDRVLGIHMVLVEFYGVGVAGSDAEWK